jgi:hypothetical protein
MLTAAFMLVGTARSGMAAGCLPYEPATVTVTGKGQMALGYGPPGFGEDPAHDAKERYVLFTVDHPFCVSGGKPDLIDEDVASVRRMQLVFEAGQHFDAQLIGQVVAVSGQLFHRISGGHTDVMIKVAAVRKAP